MIADGTVTDYRSYIAVPVFFFLWAGYKFGVGSRSIAPRDVDLVTGLRAIDEEEQRFLAEQAAKGPRTRWQRIWDAL